MERLNYTPHEVREAFRYVREQSGLLARSHAGNWRTKFTHFIDALTKNQEALALLVRLFEGHQKVKVSLWFREAAERRTPALPADRYERLALVWQIVARSMQTRNPDGFDSREKIDLPYVLVNSDLPGGSLGEKFEELRLRYIVPFCEELDRLGRILDRDMPKDAKKEFDLWDAAIAAFGAEAPPEEEGEGGAASEGEGPGTGTETETGSGSETGTGTDTGTGTGTGESAPAKSPKKRAKKAAKKKGKA